MSSPEPTAPTRVSAWRVIVTVLLTSGLLVIFLTQVSLGRILDMIRRADLPLLALAAAAYALTYAGRAARWRRLITSQRVPWPAMLGITSVHNFMLRALPGKIGETTFLVMMRARGVPGTEALAGLVVARIYDVAASILFFVLSLFLAHPAFKGSLAANVAAAAAILVLCALAVLRGSLFVRTLNALAGRVAHAAWFPLFLKGHGLRRRLGRLEVNLEQIQSARQAPMLLFTTLWIWIPSFLMTWWLLAAFHTPFGFWAAVFASTLALVATFLPVGTLGNFGTQEAGWTFGLMLLGADRETAIATGFSTHLVGFALAALFGLAGTWLAGAGLFGTGRPRTGR